MKLTATEFEMPGTENCNDDRMYVRINDIYDVRILKTDDGITVEVWPYQSIGEPLASCSALDSDAIAENE